MGPDVMILVFWMLNFRPAFSLSSFTFIKRLFSSSSLSAIRGVSHAYLRLWIFLHEILIRACASSSLAFRMMYSAFKLNKQVDNIHPRHTFQNWKTVRCSMSYSNCCFLTCIQFSQEAGKSSSVQFSSVQLSHVWLFATPWTAPLPVQASLSITNSWSLLKLVHWVSDAIQPSHPLSSPSPPAFNLSQHQGLFQWVSSHQVAEVLEFQL